MFVLYTGSWAQELYDCLASLKKELNNAEMKRLLKLESNCLHSIITQKPDFRSEKFYSKLSQVSCFYFIINLYFFHFAMNQ